VGLFLDDRKKVRAAANSIHQLCPAVRTLFGAVVEDATLEVVTIFLYLRVAQDVFNRRFVERLDTALLEKLRFATAVEAQGRVARINELFEQLEQRPDPLLAPGVRLSGYEHRVRCVVRVLLAEAGFDAEDPDLVRATFVRLDDALGHIRIHLDGIKRQNSFVMR
jgi:hypothetical protein